MTLPRRSSRGMPRPAIWLARAFAARITAIVMDVLPNGNMIIKGRREIRIDEYPWSYGIAAELVTTRQPVDLIPPYNLVHYGSGIPYFAGVK